MAYDYRLDRLSVYKISLPLEMCIRDRVYSGLAGLFILRDDQEKALNLPSDEFELPILLSDKRFSADGSLDYSPTSSEIMTGYLGDRILVNNAWAPVIQVKTRMYRLRIVNGSNARIYDLAFSNNKLFYLSLIHIFQQGQKL